LLAAAALGLCRIAGPTPRFRGRDRSLLALLRWAGATAHGTLVRASLRRPVAYEAELDLGSWLQRLAFVAGGYEWDLPPFLLRLQSSHPSGGAVTDVGANIGLISIPVALLLRREGRARARVFALEPVADNCAALRRNVGLNRLEDQVRVLQVGAGDVEVSTHVHIEDRLCAGQGTGTASILPSGSSAGPDGVPVTVRTIDSLRSEGVIAEVCAVVKLDTDGYDLKALEGAVSMLRTDRPFVFGEFDAQMLGWHDQSVRDVLALASDLGYEVRARRGSGFRFASVQAESHRQDLLLVPRELIPRVAWCPGVAS